MTITCLRFTNPNRRSLGWRRFLPLLLLVGSPAVLGNDRLLNLVIDNDAFARTDRYYTSGMMLSHLRAGGAISPYWHALADRLQPEHDAARLQLSWSLAQEIYTPDDISAAPAPAQDRPYAGYLYTTLHLTLAHQYHFDSWHLSLGLVGPSSGAARTQQRLHAYIKSEPANGWDDQLENEATLNFGFERQWRGLPMSQGERLALDMLPHLGLTVGNVMTYANAGFMLRLGSGLNEDWVSPRLRPNLPQSAWYKVAPELRWYLFLGSDARLVARNIFLDGNTRRDSASVKRKPWVVEAQLGSVFLLANWRLSYAYNVRSKEFYGQTHRIRFGSLSLAYQY